MHFTPCYQMVLDELGQMFEMASNMKLFAWGLSGLPHCPQVL